MFGALYVSAAGQFPMSLLGFKLTCSPWFRGHSISTWPSSKANPYWCLDFVIPSPKLKYHPNTKRNCFFRASSRHLVILEQQLMIIALRSCTPTLVVSCGKPVFLGWRRPTAGHGLSRGGRGNDHGKPSYWVSHGRWCPLWSIDLVWHGLAECRFQQP